LNQATTNLTSRISQVQLKVCECKSRYESVNILFESRKFDDAFIIIISLIPLLTRGFYLIYSESIDTLNAHDFLETPVTFPSKNLLLEVIAKINSQEHPIVDKSFIKEIEENIRDLITELTRAERNFLKDIDPQAIKSRRKFLFRVVTFFAVAIILWASSYFASVYIEKFHLNGNFVDWVERRGAKGAGATSPTAARIGPKNWEFVTAGGSYKIERFKFPREQHHVPGNPQFFLKWTLTEHADYAYMENRFNNIKIFEGKKIVLSFWARLGVGNMIFTSNAYQLPAGLLDNTSIMIHPSAGSPFTLTPDWQKVTIEYKIPVLDKKNVTEKGYFLIRPIFFSNKETPTIEMSSVSISRLD